MTGIGPVTVQSRACAIARRCDPADSVQPDYPAALHAPLESIETLLPILYLKGISTGDFTRRWLLARQGAGAVGVHHRPAEGGLARRARALEKRDLSPSATSTSGPTASTCRPGSRTRSNAFS